MTVKQHMSTSTVEMKTRVTKPRKIKKKPLHPHDAADCDSSSQEFKNVIQQNPDARGSGWQSTL